MNGNHVLNKTISRADLQQPEVRAAASALRKFALSLYLQGTPFSVNGVLKRRWRIRWNKLWEYSRGLAHGDFQPGQRVLDFGGGATIPVFYLARLGCEVLSLDIDEKLTHHTNAAATKHQWRLTGSTFDLTQSPPPNEWDTFDRVMSFCVLEHIPKQQQRLTIERLSSLLKPGGIFEVTFDFGEDAPVDGAIRGLDEVNELIAASGLTPMGNRELRDTGERFALDKRHAGREFTFGSLFLRKND